MDIYSLSPTTFFGLCSGLELELVSAVTGVTGVGSLVGVSFSSSTGDPVDDSPCVMRDALVSVSIGNLY